MATKIPANLNDQIERNILKILYEEKSVRTTKTLIELTLEKAMKERITISEKIISIIINQMNKNRKIQFTQKEGWKIRI